MTLEYYCKSRVRELLEALDDAIYDHATTRYLELSARLQEVARMRHMIDFSALVYLFSSKLFVVALTGLFARWAIDFLHSAV